MLVKETEILFKFSKADFLQFVSMHNCLQMKALYSLYIHMWKIIFLMYVCRKKYAEVLILMSVELYPILMTLLMKGFSASAMN